MRRLHGRVALVTGAARGIGAGIAQRFADEGAVVVLADQADSAVVSTAVMIAADGGDATAVHLDVTSEATWRGVVDRLVATYGRLDILVNNAGVVVHGQLVDTSVDDYQRVIAVNQIGPFLGIRTVAPAMTNGGSIINVSSVRGLVGAVGLGAYTATKFAVRGMTKVAALELGQRGIRVNSIHPGAVATPGVLGQAVEDLQAIDQRFATQPIARIGRPSDVAGLAAFLASDDSAYCTGAEFVVDGGALAGSPAPLR
ncbi:MAG TPA: SDR family oxidoreductase [Ilumatobacteraceae bacterium]|nr:SDR family oxidoreductase [Ilumatobacteraceae bacterium]